MQIINNKIKIIIYFKNIMSKKFYFNKIYLQKHTDIYHTT